MESFHAHLKSPRGFTLVEMLVVLAIILLLTVVVINGQSDFDRSLTITDSAYTVALSLRQAQTFGLSSRATQATNKAGYGARFEIAKPQSYVLFADVQNQLSKPAWCPITQTGLPDDKPGNCLYDSATEILQTYTFSRGFYVSRICGRSFVSPGTLYCSDDASSPLQSIDMVFLRPNTDSIITGNRVGIGDTQLVDARIVLTSPRSGSSRLICLSYAGEVSVATSTCP